MASVRIDPKRVIECKDERAFCAWLRKHWNKEAGGLDPNLQGPLGRRVDHPGAGDRRRALLGLDRCKSARATTT
jgi:hypothetical protein